MQNPRDLCKSGPRNEGLIQSFRRSEYGIWLVLSLNWGQVVKYSKNIMSFKVPIFFEVKLFSKESTLWGAIFWGPKLTVKVLASKSSKQLKPCQNNFPDLLIL